MRKKMFIALLVLLLTLSAIQPALAKGPAAKITVTGPGLSGPVEITETEILEDFSPWSTAFVDKQRGPLTEPPETRPVYEVTFYIPEADGEPRLAYVVQYALDPLGEQGYIYLPGRGEKWYTLNVSTILLDGLDGKWHHASASWDAAIIPLLRGALAGQADLAAGPSTAFVPLDDLVQTPVILALLAIFALGGLAVWLSRRRRGEPA